MITDAGWFDEESRWIIEVIQAGVCHFNVNASTAHATELQAHQQQATDLARYCCDRTNLWMGNSSSQRRVEEYSEEEATASIAGQAAEKKDEEGRQPGQQLGLQPEQQHSEQQQ